MSFCRTMSSASSIEICCGTAGLSAALRKEGMEAFGIDFKSRLSPKAPVVKIDVSTKEGQQRTLSFISEIQPQFIHFSPPGNTAGKARDKRITSGAPCPSKLRSNEFPAGLPGLSAQDLAGQLPRWLHSPYYPVASSPFQHRSKMQACNTIPRSNEYVQQVANLSGATDSHSLSVNTRRSSPCLSPPAILAIPI